MKSNRIFPVLAVILTLCLALTPAYGASKEIIQLQTQVDQLQHQMTQMTQSFNERMGVMKNLVEQNTDTLKDLQASINKQQQDRASQVDQISGQIQALNDTMDELKVRMTKLSKQLEDMQSTQQSLAATQAQQQQQAQAIAQAPPPDVLYNNALRDYNGGKPDLASQELNDYVKFYPNTDLAGNAHFYLAELQFRAGDYPIEEGVCADRTREGGTRRTGIAPRDPALSQEQRSHPGAREITEDGGGAEKPVEVAREDDVRNVGGEDCNN